MTELIAKQLQTVRYQITGLAQGIGFRPLVHRLATQLNLNGWVRNCLDGAEIIVQGSKPTLALFDQDLTQHCRHLPGITLTHDTLNSYERFTRFDIRSSDTHATQTITLPLDRSICSSCLKELYDPNDRRYRYAFTHCARCGPRYSILTDLPYDRQHTSLNEFVPCEHCEKEYTSPSSRRFHAQNNSCPVCGPQLHYRDRVTTDSDPERCLALATQTLQAGKVLALKGIGGYHLMVDALNAEAVQRLRELKQRPDKPFAVMYPTARNNLLRYIDDNFILTEAHADTLLSAARPIVLLEKKPDNPLVSNINPGLREVGVMLPYTALHFMLLDALQSPIVASSANRHGEPILYEDDQLLRSLGDHLGAVLSHNRRIQHPSDDSVFRIMASQARPLRLGRGHTPTSFNLKHSANRTLLAVGAHAKNTVALAHDTQLILSPHVGDLSSIACAKRFDDTITKLQKLYQIEPEAVVCDTHPDYQSSVWAKQNALPVIEVQHHHAHASALWFEQQHWDDCAVFCWDGFGLGLDQTLWGGETFIGQPGRWQRIASMRPIQLIGADKASRQIKRSRLSVLLAMDLLDNPGSDSERDYAWAWQQGLGRHQSHSVGRLFDAAACMILKRNHTSFEGQAACELETLAKPTSNFIELAWRNSETINKSDSSTSTPTPHAPSLSLDWTDLFHYLKNSQDSIETLASVFHSSFAQAIVSCSERLRETHGIEHIGLSGGVFQNKRLLEQTTERLLRAGFHIGVHRKLPPNDACISVGQIIEAGALNR